MKKLILMFVFLFSLCFAGDERKSIEFNYIAFRVDGMIVSITPKYGKIYGHVDAIEVAWTIGQTDTTGRIVMVTDKEMIVVEDDLRGAYFKAKSIFMDKQRELQNLFENSYLPPEKEYRKKK